MTKEPCYCRACVGDHAGHGPCTLPSNGMNILRELPPEFDAFAQEAMRTKARRTKPDHESMGGMSDEWLANELRMLSRHDLWHEAFCTAARDRIMRLSMQLAEARGIIDKLKSSRDETSGRPPYLCDATRFKLGFDSKGRVNCFSNFSKQLAGRWVALVGAEDDAHLRPAVEPTPEPKVGDEVVLNFTSPMVKSREGWKIHRIDRPEYFFLSDGNGSEISLLRGQFAVKASGEQLYRLRPLCICPKRDTDDSIIYTHVACPIHGGNGEQKHGL